MRAQSRSFAEIGKSQGFCMLQNPVGLYFPSPAELLAPIERWCTDGFDTADRLEAKALLQEQF